MPIDRETLEVMFIRPALHAVEAARHWRADVEAYGPESEESLSSFALFRLAAEEVAAMRLRAVVENDGPNGAKIETGNWAIFRRHNPEIATAALALDDAMEGLCRNRWADVVIDNATGTRKVIHPPLGKLAERFADLGWGVDAERAADRVKAATDCHSVTGTAAGRGRGTRGLTIDPSRQVVHIDGHEIKIENETTFTAYRKIVEANGLPIQGIKLNDGRHISKYFEEYLDSKLRGTLISKRGVGGGYAIRPEYRSAAGNGP